MPGFATITKGLLYQTELHPLSKSGADDQDTKSELVTASLHRNNACAVAILTKGLLYQPSYIRFQNLELMTRTQNLNW